MILKNSTPNHLTRFLLWFKWLMFKYFTHLYSSIRNTQCQHCLTAKKVLLCGSLVLLWCIWLKSTVKLNRYTQRIPNLVLLLTSDCILIWEHCINAWLTIIIHKFSQKHQPIQKIWKNWKRPSVFWTLSWRVKRMRPVIIWRLPILHWLRPFQHSIRLTLIYQSIQTLLHGMKNVRLPHQVTISTQPVLLNSRNFWTKSSHTVWLNFTLQAST